MTTAHSFHIEECVLGLPTGNPEKPCPIHSKVQPLRKAFLNELNTNSIDEFAKNVQKGKTFLNT